MKKVFLLLCAAFCALNQTVYAVSDVPAVSAASAVVYHADSGRVLWGKNQEDTRLIASTTKIMTALIAIEHCDLNASVKITEQMANVEGSSMYLQQGEHYTVRELLYGLMLASGNDAATALAVHTAGDEAAFAALMNKKAAELGLRNTSFENPHGLDDTEHYSTALDLAKLTAYAMENDLFAKIVGTRHITIKGLTYVNHNKLLWRCDGVTGVKTGYTMAAGRALVSCCERNGERLICVTLSAPDDWNDHKRLYDWAYSAYENRVIMKKKDAYSVPVLTGTGGVVSVEPLADITAFASEQDETDYIVELPRFTFAPVHMGEKAGQVLVLVNGTVVKKVPLVYMEEYKLVIDDPFELKEWLRGIGQ